MSIIIVALPKIEDAKKIRRILLEHGFTDIVACNTASETLIVANQEQRGLVISSYKLPDMYYTQLTECLPASYEMLLVGSPSVINEADSRIMSITTPIKIFDLTNTVEMILWQIEKRYKKSKPKKRTEKEENYIRNAKHVLMDRNHLSEEESFRYIQKCSMDSGTNMVETAQMILTLIYDEC